MHLEEGGGGDTQVNSTERKITFEFLIFFLSIFDTNQVSQVPRPQQEATSHLPQEGLSQLWTKNKHMQISKRVCFIALANDLEIVRFLQIVYVCVSGSVQRDSIFTVKAEYSCRKVLNRDKE